MVPLKLDGFCQNAVSQQSDLKSSERRFLGKGRQLAIRFELPRTRSIRILQGQCGSNPRPKLGTK
jgi:hypothetical protein